MTNMERVWCDECKKWIRKDNFTRHLKTPKHLKKICLRVLSTEQLERLRHSGSIVGSP